MKLSEHFSVIEAACRCGRAECTHAVSDIIATPGLLATAARTARFMEQIRARLGNEPIRVNSWFRCAVHNAAVGGATHSYHMRGYAVDFTIKSKTPREVQALLKPYLADNDDGFIGGLGSYRGFTHVDRRTENAGVTWEG